MKPGEIPLALGLVLLALAAGLFPSVMVWMLGAIVVAPVAGILLAIGVFRCRRRAGRGEQRALGLLLVGCGLIAVAYAALAGSALAYRVAKPLEAIPPSWATPWIVLRCLLPMPLLWFGVYQWTDWSLPRRRVWAVVFFCVPLASGIVHRTLVILELLPLSA